MPQLISKIGVIFFTIAILALFSATDVIAQVIYFQDNFDDGNVSDWVVPRNTCLFNNQPAVWTTSGGKYGIKINGGGCVTETIPISIQIPQDIAYAFDVDITMPLSISMDRNFVFKYLDNNNWYGIHIYEYDVYMQKVVNGVQYFPMNWRGTYIFQPDQTYHFRVEYYPTQIKIYVDGNQITSMEEWGPTFSSTKAGLQASAGGATTSEVWFDNVVVSELNINTPLPTPTLTPTPTPTATPTSTPTSTPTPQILGSFELPFSYPNRPLSTAFQFKTAFWQRLTAAFDHVFTEGIFRPFTNTIYSLVDCPVGTLGITCYDSHNGTDFSQVPNTNVYSVSNGTVVFTSDHLDRSCTPNRGGFGCVVIIQHPNNLYSLYAHLSQININEGQGVSEYSSIGVMGNTGCPGCGVHLHFGVLKPLVNGTYQARKLTRNEWKSFLYTLKPSQSPKYKPFCTYKAPNGVSFTFQDPSGWTGNDQDPWSLSRTNGGCNITSQYLWKYDIGLTP